MWRISSVYHGTNLERGGYFKSFDDGYTGAGYDVSGGGHYFTDCRDTAQQYSRKVKVGQIPRHPYLYVVDLEFKKPFIRLNRDNCEPICIPMPLNDLELMMGQAPYIGDEERCPLINFGIDLNSSFLKKPRSMIVREFSNSYWRDGLVNINSLENDFYPDDPVLFRKRLANYSGFDSVIVVHEDGYTFVSWFSSQVTIREIWDDREKVYEQV